MAKQIDAAGVPTVHIATITPISKNVGANRIVHGISIPHPTATILPTAEEEKKARLDQIKDALKALETDVTDCTIFETAHA